MKYVSTRDRSTSFSFYDALFHGLAPDGGLFIPEHFPRIDLDSIEHAYGDSLPQLGLRIMLTFLSELPTQA